MGSDVREKKKELLSGNRGRVKKKNKRTIISGGVMRCGAWFIAGGWRIPRSTNFSYRRKKGKEFGPHVISADTGRPRIHGTLPRETDERGGGKETGVSE